MPLDFTAIDFETANSSNASACAVGLARVRDGRVVATAGWLIQPPPGHDRFFELNTRIHGLRAEDVETAKTWSEQLEDLFAFLGADVLVAHNAGFDMMVLRRACEATSLYTWFHGDRRIILDEQVVGLGTYGFTLTVLSSDDLSDDPDELEDEEAQLIESYTPKFAYGR